MAEAQQFIGCKIKIEATDDNYEGVLKSIDPRSGRLTLCKVKSVTSGKNFTGVQNFDGHEIKKIEVIGREKETQIRNNTRSGEVVKDDEDGPKLLSRKMNLQHLKKLRDIEWEKLLPGKNPKRGVLKPEDDFLASEDGGDDSVTRKPIFSNKQDNNPSGYTIIDKLGDEFNNAIKHIMGEANIGLGAEGVEKGRKGTLCWIQVATREHVLLFDMIALKKDGFVHGLKKVMESPSVQKIIHDCRSLSEQLFHQYGVFLINIFDTQPCHEHINSGIVCETSVAKYTITEVLKIQQVAEVMVYRRKKNGDLPRYVESLVSSLFNRLDLSADQVYVQRHREGLAKHDEQMWAERPLADALLEAAVKNVVYLRQLRLCLMEEMLADFVDGVDIYLGVMRDAQPDSLDLRSSDNHLLPVEFKDMKISAEKSRSYVNSVDDPWLYDEHGFHENCSGVADPHITFSHTGIWHAGSGKIVQAYHEPRLRRGRARPRTHSHSQSDGKDSSDDDIPLVAKGREALGRGVPKKPNENIRQRKPDNPDLPLNVQQRKPDSYSNKQNVREGACSEVTFVAAGSESQVCLAKEKDRVKTNVKYSHINGDSSYCTASDDDGQATLDIIPAIVSGNTSSRTISPVFQGKNISDKDISFNEDSPVCDPTISDKSDSAAPSSPHSNLPTGGRGIGRGLHLKDLVKSLSPGGLQEKQKNETQEFSPQHILSKGRGTVSRKWDDEGNFEL